MKIFNETKNSVMMELDKREIELITNSLTSLLKTPNYIDGDSMETIKDKSVLSIFKNFADKFNN